jgi:hypothetical protein
MWHAELGERVASDAKSGYLRIDDLANPRLPAEVKQLNRHLRETSAIDSLHPEKLMDEAIESTGLDDFGDPWFREPLEVLCRSLREEGGLSPLGATSQRQLLFELLCTRLRIEALIARYPQIEELTVRGPVVVAGLPRTGTTFLHSLLRADPSTRKLTPWENRYPDKPEPPPSERIVAEDNAMLERLLPYLRVMLGTEPEMQLEEVRLLALSFSSTLWESQAVLPSYVKWYSETDQRPAYAYLARVLRVLQWVGGDGQWALKTPQHVEQLPALMSTFPDAAVVITHRDPVAIVSSVSTMSAYAQRLITERVDPPAIARYWSGRITTMTDRLLRDHDRVPDGQIVDVTLADLRSDPEGTVRRVYQAAGRVLTPEAVAGMRGVREQRHPHRYGRVRYDTGVLQLDITALREGTRAYVRHFSVPCEENPLGG